MNSSDEFELPVGELTKDDKLQILAALLSATEAMQEEDAFAAFEEVYELVEGEHETD